MTFVPDEELHLTPLQRAVAASGVLFFTTLLTGLATGGWHWRELVQAFLMALLSVATYWRVKLGIQEQ